MYYICEKKSLNQSLAWVYLYIYLREKSLNQSLAWVYSYIYIYIYIKDCGGEGRAWWLMSLSCNEKCSPSKKKKKVMKRGTYHH